MRTLLNERFAPTTSEIGFLELGLEDAADGLERWRRRLYQEVHISRPTVGFPEVLSRLEPLVQGACPREVLVAAGNWTAYFDCSLRGTDAVPVIGHLSRMLECRGLVMEAIPHTIGTPGIRQGRSGSVQFEMFGPTETEVLNYVRTIYVTFDGSRWEFGANGREQPFEELLAYKARRVRDRFTSEMLERYCQALGLDVFNPGTYGPESVLIESEVPMPANPVIMTLAEAQAWLEIVPGQAIQLPG
jgi:hypothetical protein